MIYRKLFTAAAMLGAVSLVSLQPAAAAPMTPAPALNASGAVSAPIENVRYRGHRGYYRGHHGYRHGGYRHGRRYGWGPGAAIGGLAAGALIGGAIANSRAQQQSSDDAYCSQRFKSYDPASGTYLGYDGNRHSCP